MSRAALARRLAVTAAACNVAINVAVTAGTAAAVTVAAPSSARAEKSAAKPAATLTLPQADDSQSPARVDPQLLWRAYDRAKAHRNFGIGLAVPGVALTLLGGVAVGLGGGNPNLLGKASELIAGGASALVGLAIGIPGVYFWSTGQDDMDSFTWRLRQLEKR
jgi:hypothetical protein